MHRIFFAWLLMAGSVSSIAQSVSGHVIDLQNGKPLANVHVRWVNSSAGILTDESGKFSLRSVKGISILRLSYVGYRTKDVDTDTLALVEDTSVSMEATSILLDQSVNVVAQRHEQFSKEALPLVSVIDHQAIQRASPRTTPETLMNAAGVWLQKTNHGGGAPILRGLSGNQVLVLVDGIRLNNFTYRYGPNQYLNTVDPGILEQIEVTRGGGSVLYGSDALGGVVQLVTKTPTFSSGRKLTSQLSGKWMSGGMELSGRAEVSASAEKVSVLAGYSQKKFGDLIAGGTVGTLTPTAYAEKSGDMKLVVRTGKLGFITGAFQRTHQQDVSRFDQVVLGGYQEYKFDPQVRQLAYIKWEAFSKKWWKEVVKITYANAFSSERLQTQRLNSVYSRTFLDQVKTNVFIIELLSVPSPIWKVSSGVEFYSDRVRSEATEVNSVNDAETSMRGTLSDGSRGRSLSLFSHHQVTVKKLNVSSGIRINSFLVRVNDAVFGDQKLSPTAVVGNFGVRYSMSETVSPFISFQSAFRAPNIDDMSKFGPVEANVFEIPSGELSPERSVQSEVGLKLNHRNINGSVAVYHTRLSNLIDRAPAMYLESPTYEGRTVYQKENIGSAVLKGIEGEVEFSISRGVRVLGNMTYTYGQNINKGEPLRRVPPLFARAGVILNQKKWWTSYTISLAGKQTRLAPGDRSDVRISSRLKEGAMPGWKSINVSAGVDYPAWSVALNIVNVFDESYRIYGSGVDEYGRSLTLSLRIRI